MFEPRASLLDLRAQLRQRLHLRYRGAAGRQHSRTRQGHPAAERVGDHRALRIQHKHQLLQVQLERGDAVGQLCGAGLGLDLRSEV